MATGPSDTMQSFFAEQGVLFDAKPKEIERALEGVMGKDRYQRYRLVRAEGPQHRLYAELDTLHEASIFVRRQAETLLRVSERIYKSVEPLLKSGVRVLDLGSFTGAFAAWVASQHAGCTVGGVDSNAKAVKFAGDGCKLANASFVEWNYAKASSCPVDACDVLVTTFGVDFDPDLNSRHCSLDPTKLRQSAHYRARKGEALGYFSSWKHAAKPEAMLVAVLRVNSLEHCLALIDAAAESGWSWSKERSEHVKVKDERFTAFCFTRSDEASSPAQREVGVWWCDKKIELRSGECRDPLAIVLYEALGAKEILKTKDRSHTDGNTMRTTIGKTADFGFQFSRATTGYAHLKIVPVKKIARLTF